MEKHENEEQKTKSKKKERALQEEHERKMKEKNLLFQRGSRGNREYILFLFLVQMMYVMSGKKPLFLVFFSLFTFYISIFQGHI